MARVEDKWAHAPLFLGLLACLPLIGAQFGYGNQIEQLTIVARLQNPDFAPGDIYLDSAASFGPRIYYAWALAGLSAVLPMPLVIHGLSILTNFALAAVTYGATRRFLGAGALAGALAAILAVTNGSFSLGLAGYLRFDSFQPANVAISASLIGFYLLLSARIRAAVAAFGLSMLMHPLIGVEVAAIAFGATGLARVWGQPVGKWVSCLLPLVFAGLAFGALVALAWVLPTLGQGAGAPLSGPEFFAILAEFRAPHHYLGLTFPQASWVAAGLFAVVTAVAYGRHMALHGIRAETVALVTAALAVMVLCAASLVFVDILEMRAFVTAQLFRMLMVLKWVGFLGLGWMMAGWIRLHGWVGWVLALPVVIVSADGHPLAVVLAIATWLGVLAGPLVLGWIGLGRIWPLLRLAGLGLLIMASLWVARRAAIEEQSVRALAALVVLGLLFLPTVSANVRAALAASFAAVLLSTVLITRAEGIFGRDGLKSQIVWADLAGDEMEIARHAAANSPADALWLIPPELETFRMIAGRAVLVDYTSIPFDDATMALWYARMEQLYGPLQGGGFQALRAMQQRHLQDPNWVQASQAFGATHAVLYADTPWPGPVLATAGAFKAVQLP